MAASFDPVRALTILCGHDVQFVVIGGFAAWMRGAPVVTADLDIIYESSPSNVARLVAALRDLAAVYRDPMGRRIQPTEQRLSSMAGGGHHLLRTAAGDLDVPREYAGFDHSALVDASTVVRVKGVEVHFASLEDIIEMKTRAGRPKDLAALPALRAAFEDDE